MSIAAHWKSSCQDLWNDSVHTWNGPSSPFLFISQNPRPLLADNSTLSPRTSPADLFSFSTKTFFFWILSFFFPSHFLLSCPSSTPQSLLIPTSLCLRCTYDGHYSRSLPLSLSLTKILEQFSEFFTVIFGGRPRLSLSSPRWLSNTCFRDTRCHCIWLLRSFPSLDLNVTFIFRIVFTYSSSLWDSLKLKLKSESRNRNLHVMIRLITSKTHFVLLRVILPINWRRTLMISSAS